MNNIFTDAERQEKRKFREERVNKIISVGKETTKTLYKGSVKTGKAVSSGIMSYKPNEKKLFTGGQEVKKKAIERFASSGKSELHAKGSFEDMKKRFGRFE